MTDRQSNSLDMFLVVRTFHTNNALVIDTVPARAAAFGLHSTRVTAINALVSTQSGNDSGITADKAALRNTLDTLSFDHMTAALAWARIQSNQTLAAEFDYTQSDIQKVKDDTIIAFCQHRYQLINSNSVALADYGILPATLTAWQTAMTAYEPLITGPRVAKVSKKVITAQIKSLFKQTNDHLRNILDPLMLALRATQPQLYLGYQSSRIIIDRRGPGSENPPTPPTTTIKIDGTVAGNMFPLPNASITVTVGATSYPTIAGPAGIYAVSIPNPAPSTAATITASAATFTPETRNITLQPNQNQTQDFNLTSAPPMP
jgi:hypothetical protein